MTDRDESAKNRVLAMLGYRDPGKKEKSYASIRLGENLFLLFILLHNFKFCLKNTNFGFLISYLFQLKIGIKLTL